MKIHDAKKATHFRALFGPYRAVLGIRRAVFGIHRAVFGKPRAVFGQYNVVFGQYRAVFGPCRAVFGQCRAVFGTPALVNSINIIWKSYNPDEIHELDLGGCWQGGWEEIGCVYDPQQVFKMLYSVLRRFGKRNKNIQR